MKMKSAFIAALVAAVIFPARTQAQGFGLGPLRDGNNCPSDAVNFNECHKGSDAYALTSDEDTIILTFDQGYENGYTSKILDTLRDKNVKAIFFLTGDYAKKENALVRRMIDEGHMLGNHGMTHASLCNLSPDSAREEILSLHAYVADNYDYEMQYFRFPCGEYSEDSLKIVRECGYKTLFWSFA